MWNAILGIGSSIISAFSQVKIADLMYKAQLDTNATILEQSKLDADGRKMQNVKSANSSNLGVIYDFEKKKLTSSAMQIGVLIIGIVVVGIIFIRKKSS